MNSAHRAMRATLGSLVAAAMVAAAFAAPAAATSTTVSPAGDEIGFADGSKIAFRNWLHWTSAITCDIAGGSGVIPSSPDNHNSSGPVTVTFDTQPTLSNCTGPYSSGTVYGDMGDVALTFQNGSPSTASLDGYVSFNFGCSVWMYSETGDVPVGTWTNGTTSPLVASKAIFPGGIGTLVDSAGCTWSVYVLGGSNLPLKVEDLTDPDSVVEVSS